MRTLEQILKDIRDSERDVQTAQTKLARAKAELTELRDAVLKVAA